MHFGDIARNFVGDKTKYKAVRKEIKIGIATGGILCVWLFGGFYLAGNLHLAGRLSNVRAITGLIGLVVLFAGVFLSIRKGKEENQDFTYWQAVKTGVIVSLTVAIVISFAGGLHVLLYPQYANDMVKEAEQSLRQSNLTVDEINTKLESVRKEYSLFMQMTQPLIAQSVAGTLFSIILSFFFRTKK